MLNKRWYGTWYVQWNIILKWNGMKYWNNMDELWKNYAKWKKARYKGHILKDSIHMKFPNRQIHRDRKYLSSFQGLGGEGKADGYGVSSWDDRNVPDTDDAGKCTIL